MKNLTCLLAGTIALLALGFRCKKDGGGDALPYTITAGNFYNGSADPVATVWLVLSNQQGKVVAARKFNATPFPASPMTIVTEAATALDSLDLTVYSFTEKPAWKVFTWRHLPSGATVYQYEPGGGSGSYGIYVNTSIAAVPDQTTIQVPGAESNFIANQTGSTVTLNGSLSFGFKGFLLRALPGGQSDWLAYWQPHDILDPFTTQITFGFFRKDLPKLTLKFPKTKSWEYSILGVTQENSQGQYAYLASGNQSQVGTATFENPPELFARYFNVVATDNESNYYDLLLPANGLEFSPIDFGVQSAEIVPEGNSYHLTTNTFGEFDVLDVRMDGVFPLFSWTITGAPKDLTDFVLPVLPDTISVPKLMPTGNLYPQCTDFLAFHSFQEALGGIKNETFTRAKAGWRRHIGY